MENTVKNHAQRVKKPIYKKWWFWCIVILILCSFFSSTQTDVTEGTGSIPSNTDPFDSVAITTTLEQEDVNEYVIVERFVELFNESGENKISDTYELDIHGTDYRVEYRLNSFDNAVGLKGSCSGCSIEIVNYGAWKNEDIRIYAFVDNIDIAKEIVTNSVHILDDSISDEDILSELDDPSSIYLGTAGKITGYINESHSNGGIDGYDVMVDCGDLTFAD